MSRRSSAKETKKQTPTAASGCDLIRKNRVGLPLIIFIIVVCVIAATTVQQVLQGQLLPMLLNSVRNGIPKIFFRGGILSALQPLMTLDTVIVETRLRVPLFLHGSQKGLASELNLFQRQPRFTEKYAQLQLQTNLHSEGISIQEISFLQDVVLLPEEALFLVRLPSAESKVNLHKSSLRCSFSDKISTRVNGIDYLLQSSQESQGRAAVRCQTPPEGTQWSARQVALYDTTYNSVTAKSSIDYSQPIQWDFLVYESFVTDIDVILFAKGINHKQGLNVAAQSLRCVFNHSIETSVTTSAQEVFRCEHPHEQIRSDLVGSKISLLIHGKTIPSVAYYELPSSSNHGFLHVNSLISEKNPVNTTEKQVNLCACTMVFNVGKYVREWVIYNSHLGVEHFFLYDNNSEDSLEETLGGLSEYNVTRYPWPWTKAQESGFSHCALMAKDKCKWMMYTDVDEFAFSPSWLKILKANGNGHQDNILEYNREITSKSLKLLVMNLSSYIQAPSLKLKQETANVGQLSLRCRNFGPSGLHEHPQSGVTQGYICRQKQEQRHKSILLLDALSSSLLNVIHHFQLKPGYKTLYVNSSKAVINHYKYQVWTEFKTKFRRRVSAYVVDWKESRNLASRDRTPGLGYRAVKPHRWEKMFCEVKDIALREFTMRVFSLYDETGSSKMQWQWQGQM
eukprot:Gb_33001 [translate_table: standard]